jgi:protein-L-isoaspartate(D-aspartate) O-methyltransferase
VTIVEGRPDAGFETARKAMIDSQLRTVGVNAPFVLRRMGEVARERFVPEALRGSAYIDRPVPLGDGRWLAPAEVQGVMLQEALPKETDRALLVDGGSGYMAELLRPLVASLEVIDPVAGASGKAEGAGFTLLVIDGAVEQVPESLAALLAPEGRIVTGLLTEGVTRMAVGRIAGGAAALLPVAEIGIPVLPEFAAPKKWTF